MRQAAVFWLLVVACGTAAVYSSRPSRPHVVMFVIDDLGWTDVGYRNGSGVFTPFLDQMASTGMVLDRFYVQPVCSPSRSALMLGRYPFHTGMQHYATLAMGTRAAMPLDQPTMAEVLTKAGYRSNAVGKWHLGYAKWENTPTGRGFESHLGYYQGMEDYYKHSTGIPYLNLTDGYDFWRNRTAAFEDNGTYSLDVYNAEWKRIIDSYTAEHPDKVSQHKNPLFLYMAHQNVHIPLEVPAKYLERCGHITDPGRHIYCGMLLAVDESMQMLVQYMRSKHMWDNTLFVITTDNGGMPNWAGKFPASSGCNYPLRGGKTTVFEGGVRGIGIVQGGVLPRSMQGVVNKDLMHLVDWLPTIVGMAGLSAEEVRQYRATLDGFDMWPVWAENASNARLDVPVNINIKLSWPETGHQNAIIKWPWKLIQQTVESKVYNTTYDGWYPPPPAKHIPAPENPRGNFLFNLDTDPNEHNNVYQQHPDVVKELNSSLHAYMAKYVAPQRNVPAVVALPWFHNGTWAPFES